MTNKNCLNEALTLSFNDEKFKTTDSTLNNFSVIEDFYVSKETGLKSESGPEATSIFIVTKGSGTAKLDSDAAEIQENSMVKPTSNINDVSMERQSFRIGEASFPSAHM